MGDIGRPRRRFEVLPERPLRREPVTEPPKAPAPAPEPGRETGQPDR